jgi:hypothetical protein
VPLKPGYSKQTIRKNTEEMIASGHPPDQAYAASMASARKHAKARGKKPAHLKKGK